MRPELKKNDFYPTPAPVVQAFVNRVNYRDTDTFLEPCLGNGVVFDAVNLPESQKQWCEIEHSQPKDYLRTKIEPVDLIITNPPFSLFESFLIKSLWNDLKPGGTACYLLRLNAFGAKKRRVFWSIVGKPTNVINIVPRISFVGNTCDNAEYAWFCWDYGNRINAESTDWVYWKGD